MTARPAIHVDGVAKRFRLVHERNATLKATIFRGWKRLDYEEFWALDGVSFDVPEGSTFGLIGENGSGKSTLLKCMARIYRPDRGAIAINGKVSALLELGAGFHPELSGRENVFLNGSILGLSRRQIADRFDAIVEFAGLERFIDSPVKNYSSGMFVRLGFSVAINVEPDVLLVDEVLAVGDEDFQQRCLEKFAQFRRDGRTVVIVSHGLEAVRHMCDHAVWLDHGAVAEVGPAGNVVDAYLGAVRDHRRAREGGDLSPAWSPEAAGAGGSRPALGPALTGVELLDAAGRPTTLLHLGSAARVRISLSPGDGDQRLSVGVDIVRSDGAHVSGSVCTVDASPPPSNDGRVVEYHIERVLLRPGVYELSVALTDEGLGHVFDHAERTVRFDVVDDGGGDERGLVSMGGTWSEDADVGRSRAV